MNNSEILFTAIKTAQKAGKLILSFYNSEFKTEYKQDNSPVTQADIQAAKLINEALQIFNIPIINEESSIPEFEERQFFNRFWLIDPLDGTKEFIKQNGEFTVNLALIENNLPILGVIGIPATSEIYFAEASIGSFKCNLSETEMPENLADLIKISIKLPIKQNRQFPIIVGSRSNAKQETKNQIELLRQLHPNAEVITTGSSIKFCLLAEGFADYYPRFSPCMEWDTAAGHAIAKFAGKTVLDISTKNELLYNKKSLVNPSFIVS